MNEARKKILIEECRELTEKLYKSLSKSPVSEQALKKATLDISSKVPDFDGDMDSNSINQKNVDAIYNLSHINTIVNG